MDFRTIVAIVVVVLMMLSVADRTEDTVLQKADLDHGTSSCLEGEPGLVVMRINDKIVAMGKGDTVRDPDTGAEYVITRVVNCEAQFEPVP